MGDAPGVRLPPAFSSHCPAPGGASCLKDVPFLRPRSFPHPQNVPESVLRGCCSLLGPWCPPHADTHIETAFHLPVSLWARIGLLSFQNQTRLCCLGF